MKIITRVTPFLTKSFMPLVAIGVLIMLGNVLLTNIIFALTGGFKQPPALIGETLSYELMIDVFALVIGLIFFTKNLKIMVANGISRKTFFLANFPAIVTAAAALTIVGIAISLVHNLFVPTILYSEFFYNHGLLGALAIQFAAYFMLIILGWFVALLYYRSSPVIRWIISVIPLFLIGMVISLDHSSSGKFVNNIVQFVMTFMGMSIHGRDPYVATLNLFLMGLAIYVFVFLLLRKAPIKD